MISEDLRTDLLDALNVCRFPEILHIVAKPLANNSQLLLESLQTRPDGQLALAQAIFLASGCFPKGYEDHTNPSVRSSLRETRSHVEVCHVYPILLCNNPLDVRLGNRLIIHVIRPIQNRGRLTETPCRFNTELALQIRPSLLVTLETFHLGKHVVLATCTNLGAV